MRLSLRARLRQWLRNWLGIEANYDLFANAIRRNGEEVIGRIEDLKEAVIDRDQQTRQFVSEAIQNLQQQLNDLASVDGPLAKPEKPSDPKPQQATAGHLRFTDRRRAYEFSKRGAKDTPVGQQIAENDRLIASGTRKADANG
jgi:hypothetical protein